VSSDDGYQLDLLPEPGFTLNEQRHMEKSMKIYLWFQTTDSCILAHALQENQ